MANPHFEIKITKRSKRQSAVAGAAYQSGENLFSEYDQKHKDYRKKEGVHLLRPPKQLVLLLHWMASEPSGRSTASALPIIFTRTMALTSIRKP